MKKIIVAMDFSRGAINAMDYAIDLALTANSEVLLLWVDTNFDEKTIVGEKNEIRHDAKLELKRIIEEKKEKHEGLQISFKLKKGKVYQELASQVLASNADLVVVGTHGISGFEEFWVGSNAFKIISYSPCPVISVRADFTKSGSINRILIPIDDTFDTTKKVPMATKIAVAFGAQAELLGIYYSELPSLKKITDGYIKESERYLLRHGLKTNFKACSSNNVSASIVKYAEDSQADLIVIMTDQDKANHDIIMGNNAQQIINRSSIPILSVKPGEMVF